MTKQTYIPKEPIAAVATAFAPAALGVIRVSGENCVSLVAKIFSRPKALNAAAGNTIVYGWIVDRGGVKIDEVLVSVFRSPKSFTGEEAAEISCHGGLSAVKKIFGLLLQSGFRQAERGEFSFRSFLNGKSDLTKAEAAREIVQSRTDAAQERAAGRLSGSLFLEISSIKNLLVKTLSQIEVEIEYPEDEETISDAFDKSNLFLAQKGLRTLCESWAAEKLYQEGARIVLCGKTNAGKSSLFNALLKEDRSIVSCEEGTTRDWIESFVSVDGIPARLFDTAGLRKTSDAVELKGLEATADLSAKADVILYLADASFFENEIDFDFLCERNENVIFVWNKIDKIAKADEAKKIFPSRLSKNQKSKIKNLCAEIFVSAKTGEGIKELVQKTKAVLLGGEKTERAQAGLGSERQKNLVSSALESVEHAILVSKNFSLDAVVQDLEDALFFLGELTGEVTSEDILESVFANFCVGK